MDRSAANRGRDSARRQAKVGAFFADWQQLAYGSMGAVKMSDGRHSAAIIGVMIGLMASGTAASARPTVAEMICTNPASGTNWPIEIDFDRHTVDSYPAQISDSEIVWYDPKAGGTYTLFRRTGELRFIGPSSTGGYSIFDRCAPAKSN